MMRRGIAASLLRAFALSATVLVAGYTGVADAAKPELTITRPKSGTITPNPEPTFGGTTSVDGFGSGSFTPVMLVIYKGPTAETEPPVSEVQAVQGEFSDEWSAVVTPSLADGAYTAVAQQSELEGKTVKETGKSNAVTFTVVTARPVVAITDPANGSSSSAESKQIAGSSSTAPYDIRSVTVEVFGGATIPASATPPVATAIVAAPSGSWSEVFVLPPGTYTARATQRDEAGNVGVSAPDTFTLIAPARPSQQPPVAAFSWVPAAPVAGQPVALVSGSTDAISPITGFAWDLAGSGPFAQAGPVLSTTFATPGNHVVRLQVTDARGASSVAAEAIPVSPAGLMLMQPFPIVRIAGSESSSGVRLSSLNVQAPVGVRVSVTCTGRGCAMKSQSAQARATAHNRRGNAVVVSFPRFERFLPAGVTLEVRVFAAGEIGKYTRFVIHRHSVPKRSDACLAGLNPKPIACPG